MSAISPFHSAVSAALQSVRDFAGLAVTYQRGVDSVSIAKAVVGQSAYTAASGENVEVGMTERDYLIAASDIVIDDVEVEPREGDKIVETGGGKVYTYVVMPTAGIGDSARWSDPGRSTWRIHTQLDSIEEEA